MEKEEKMSELLTIIGICLIVIIVIAKWKIVIKLFKDTFGKYL